MKALTVRQPYASMLLEPEFTRDDPKSIENRTWRTRYRGQLVIHAGASRKYLGTYAGQMPDPMPFSVALGIVDLIDCVLPREIRTDPKWRYLSKSPHAEGPWCLVTINPRRFPTPIVYSGEQGLWNFPDYLLPEGF